MAVYTVLDHDEIQEFIEPYGIGPLVSFEGVTAGVENTNYFITTDQSEFGSEYQTEPLQHYVLTIFESIPQEELAFYAQLTSMLNLKGLPVPCPIKDINGQMLQSLHNKPALIIPKIKGSHPTQTETTHCRQIGEALGSIHQACIDAQLAHPSIRSLEWLTSTALSIQGSLDTAQQTLSQDVLAIIAQLKDMDGLPRSIIHGDLFKDNAIFDEQKLTAIIDFNSAGDGYLLLDLAIVANDWCSNSDGRLNQQLCEALLDGYNESRPLTKQEQGLWKDFLKVAAFRFWTSRLQAQFEPDTEQKPGGLLEQKDPAEYELILQHRMSSN